MPSLSVERWLALATAGDSQARFHLGKIFSCGLGVHQDYKQAIYWFQLAAEQGHAEAQFQLGRLYAFSDLRNDALGKVRISRSCLPKLTR